ncbi:MAG: LytTR family DNA-binding domain-containing protein [Oscillospiraceae bacterium]
MIKIAICDDQKHICNQIEKIITNYKITITENIETEVFYSGAELCKHMSNNESFDLIFLDIEMEDVNGVEVGKIIREQMCNQAIQIVYISGKNNYCLELFAIRPMDFVQKPVTKEKIVKEINLFLSLTAIDERLFRYKQGHISYAEPIKNILYFESQNRTIKIITRDKETEFYSTLQDIQQSLCGCNFVLIHKSFLVNYAHIVEFGSKELKMSNNVILPISQQRRKDVAYMQLMIEKEKVNL